MKKATYPRDHKPAMQVPVGGSSCSKCVFYNPDGNRCRSRDYQRYYGTDKIPAPPDQFCSDWFETSRVAERKPALGAGPEPEPEMAAAGAGAFYGG